MFEYNSLSLRRLRGLLVSSYLKKREFCHCIDIVCLVNITLNLLQGTYKKKLNYIYYCCLTTVVLLLLSTVVFYCLIFHLSPIYLLSLTVKTIWMFQRVHKGRSDQV